MGIIPKFTGVSDPFEVPENPEIRLDSTTLTHREPASHIFLYPSQHGFMDALESRH